MGRAQASLQFSDILGFPFLRGKHLQSHTNGVHNLKYHHGFFSSFAFKNCSPIESTGIRKARKCALHDEILQKKIAVRTGPAPAPLTHWKNSVICQTFQNTRKKNKFKAAPGINLWGPNEKLPPNESITRNRWRIREEHQKIK